MLSKGVLFLCQVGIHQGTKQAKIPVLVEIKMLKS